MIDEEAWLRKNVLCYQNVEVTLHVWGNENSTSHRRAREHSAISVKLCVPRLPEFDRFWP